MKFVPTLVISSEFRALVMTVADRLGNPRVVASRRWQTLAAQFDVGEPPLASAAVLIVGAPADLLKHAATENEEFGFVIPVSHETKWWQRGPHWRDDTTLDLWKAGWSPVTIDRLLVPTHAATVEFVIGSARPIPAVEATDEAQ